MIDWLSKNKIEVIILLFMGTLVNVGQYLQMHGFHLTFQDTDDYMRLVRTREFFNNYDLSNTIISRSNVPFGCDLHWTRFYDFFIIVPTYILNFFIGSIDKSIEYVCFFISPIVKSVTVAVFFNIVQKLMKKKDAFLCAAIFAAHPLIMSFGIFGRPDHHAFIMLFIVIYLYSAINIIESKFHDRKACVKAAMIAALCVWISPETLIPILLIDGVLFVYSFSKVDGFTRGFQFFFTNCSYNENVVIQRSEATSGSSFFNDKNNTLDPYVGRKRPPLDDDLDNSEIKNYDGLKCLYIKSLLTACFITAIVLIPWSSIADFNRIVRAEYDKISIVHAILFFCGALYYEAFIERGQLAYRFFSLFNLDMFGLFVGPLNRKKLDKSQIAKSVILFFIIAAGFLLAFPNFLKGMSAGVDDYVKEIWLYRVAEMKSPFAHGDGAFFLSYCIIVGVSIVSKTMELIRRKSDGALIWSTIIANAVCYTIFGGVSYRMIPYSALFALPLIIDFGMNGALTKSFCRLSRIIVSAFLSMFFIFVTAGFKPTEENKALEKPTYTREELFEAIGNLSKEPVVIMAHTNDGPSLLYYTKHSVVGAPYHRQVQGIISSHKVMEGEYDEKTVKDILKSTDSSYIFVRKSKRYSDKSKRPSLARMIIDNNLPEWLEVVKLPEKFSDIIVAKVDRGKL